ncbi:scavenger receptor cysteine-rich type 1 protein M160-like [Dicentrarchus labrax]|uniref:SRCR domain-containing protein n=1 Tax=Dicentrarchus labrax TaxID=13489 RepID=A0A8C4F205_DICLA|nr:scavenger receptor cysteine-rich type 1 protein M160-like [Dicentrarchus labrax]
MDPYRVLTVFLSLWSSVVPADVRLVGGASRCAGSLEQRHQGDWRPVVDQYNWNLTSAAAVCQQLDCGSVVSLRRTQHSSIPMFVSEFGLMPISMVSDELILEITCSDSVRLLDGTSLCSGRLEVKSDQSNQSWSSVCKEDFDLRDAEVVCRELGCGAPSALQGALDGGEKAPMWTREFQCKGDESALLDCDSSVRNTCSSGKVVGLTCLDPSGLRLVGGASRCSGTLEMNKLGEWKPLDERDWDLRVAGIACGLLDCGSPVSTTRRMNPAKTNVWAAGSNCASSLMDCFDRPTFSHGSLEITCSDSVRLLNGTNLCSGRLEVKSNQLWSSVCEDDFDQQGAEVVCKELGCGAPSVFKGGLYREVEAPVWVRELPCGGDESALLDCLKSGSARSTCSPGKAVGLTCSDPNDVRLVGGTSRCTGILELKHRGEWKSVVNADFRWDLKVAAAMCGRLDCGSVVSAAKRTESSERPVWWINSPCVQSESTLKECVTMKDQLSEYSLEITCSDSVRLLNGTSLCSGRLEVKSNQSWSSVCEEDFDLRDAEVVCRELGCGAPLVLQGALYGGEKAPMWTREFQCEGNESALRDCDRSGSARGGPCSPGRAVGLTCSDPDYIRLVGEASRCAGTLELKNQGEWRPVAVWDSQWDQSSAAAACGLLDCGSAVSTEITDDASDRLVWWIRSSCVQAAATLLECVTLTNVPETYTGLNVTCSDLLAHPNISLSPSTDGVSKAKWQGLQVLMGSNFTITCSVEPQYQEGSFQLVFASSDAAQNYTLPAVNHSAHFLFPAADHAHQGDYRCVYHVYVFSHNFSSESQTLYLAVGASVTELIIRLVVLLLGLMLLIIALCCHSEACRRRWR